MGYEKTINDFFIYIAVIDTTLLDLTDPREPDYGEPLNLQEGDMPDINEVYQSNSTHLKAEDLGNKEVKVTIESASVETIGNDTKIVVKFKGKDKDLVLNKTNATKIAVAHGGDYTLWSGSQIILYPDVTEYNGKPTPCIRVRAVLEQADSDSIPF